MFTEKITVRCHIYRICVSVIKQVCHDLLQNTNLIAFGIKVQEFALLRIGKLIDTGKIVKKQKLLTVFQSVLCGECFHPEKPRPLRIPLYASGK